MIIVFSSIAGQRCGALTTSTAPPRPGSTASRRGCRTPCTAAEFACRWVRPGFVIGAMTRELMASGVKPAPMSKTADQVADAVVRADRRGKTVVGAVGTGAGDAQVPIAAARIWAPDAAMTGERFVVVGIGADG